jgi:beta-lactamase regulating signal transducer with metallopeptidase domain
MEALLQFGLANAAAAALLAIVIAAVTRFWRNPYLAHVLWAIVLLRLVAPPMLQIPFRTPEWFARKPAAIQTPTLSEVVRLKAADVSPPKHADSATAFRPAEVPDGDLIGASHDPRPPLPAPRGRVAPTTESPTPPIPQPSFARSLQLFDVLGGVWIAGTVLYIAITAARVRRFARALRRSQCPASGWLEQEIGDIAKSIGLRRPPRLMVVDGPLPPMIWSGWRPMLLVPQRIVESIDPSQRQLILLHELLHIRRGDHLVRWFAVAVLALYWWYPFAWWAVRRLQNAEEECCDAAVLALHPQQSETYGGALLAVSEFVSCGSLPAAAVSVGVERKYHLKRRMTMILKETRWPQLSGGRLAVLIAFGAIALGVSLTTAAAQIEPAGSANKRAPNANADKTGASEAIPRAVDFLAREQQDSGKSSTPSALPASTLPSSVTSKPKRQPGTASSPPRLRPATPSTMPDLSEDMFIKIQPGDDETQRMLKERHNAAVRGLRLSEYQYDIRTANVGLVLSAARSVLDARLALVKTPEEQIRARQEYLVFVTSYWKRAKAKLDIGGATGFSPVDEAQSREAMFDAKLKLAQALRATTGKESATPPSSTVAASFSAPKPGTTPAPSLEVRTAAGRVPAAPPDWLTAKPLQPASGDHELVKLFKERYNAALKSLQGQYERAQIDAAMPMVTITLAASGRTLLDAELALSSGKANVPLYERYLELTKFFEDRAAGLLKAKSIGPADFDAAREARLDAEIKLIQAKAISPPNPRRTGAFVQSLEVRVRIAEAEVNAVRAVVDQSQAEMKRAVAHLDYRRIQLNRLAKLQKQNAVTTEVVEEGKHACDEATASVETARASIRAAEAQVAIKQAQLEQAKLELEQAKAADK